MFLSEFIKRLIFWKNSDRIGPNIPTSHYKLFFKKSMRRLCTKKFNHFGENADFRPGAYAIACSKISIGKKVVIRPTTMLFAEPIYEGGEIIIEDDVLIGSGVHIYTSNHKFDNLDIPIAQQGYSVKKVCLKKGCWVGANVIILPGVTIGEHSVIGAGSIVTKDVPSFVFAAGNPTKIIRKLKEL